MINTNEISLKRGNVPEETLTRKSISSRMSANIENTERSIKYIFDFFNVNGIDEATKYLGVKIGNIITIGQEKYKIQSIKANYIKIVSIIKGNPVRTIKLDELKFLISQGQFLPLNRLNTDNKKILQRRKYINQTQKTQMNKSQK